MGQYYNILVGDMPMSVKTTYKVYDRSVDTQYTMTKLIELFKEKAYCECE